MKNLSLLEKLAFLYALLFPIKILYLPPVGYKIQPADILFLVLLLCAVPLVLRLKTWQFSAIDKAIGVWLLAQTLTCAAHPTRNSVLECVGTVYLVLLYGVFQLIFKDKSRADIRQFWLSAAQWSVVAVAVVGLLGIVLAALGKPTFLVFEFENYPYFGTVYRAQSYTMQPIMLASVLSVLGFFVLAKSRIAGFTKVQIGVLTLLSIAFVFTFAKSILLFFGITIFLLSRSQSILYKRLANLILVSSIAVYLFAAHFVLMPKANFERERDIMFGFVARTPSVSVGDFHVLKTGYAMLKEKAFYLFTQHPIVGVGADNLKLQTYRETELDYGLVRGFEPHSSFTGILAELGLVGLVAFIGLFIVLFSEVFRLLKTELSVADRWWVRVFGCVFLYMLCEGVATDVMNFRHYWLCFAVFAAWRRS